MKGPKCQVKVFNLVGSRESSKIFKRSNLNRVVIKTGKEEIQVALKKGDL